MEHQSLRQPLLATSSSFGAAAAATTKRYSDGNISSFSSSRGIILRLLFIIIIGMLSIWANHEASKGFDLTILNDARDSPAGRRFTLLYVSNDKATRILLHASSLVERILYDPLNNRTKKRISRVTVRLASTMNSTSERVTVRASKSNEEFVITISPSIMECTNVNKAVTSELQRAMARIWLWDAAQSGAPPRLVDGMVEYSTMLAGFGHSRGVGDSPVSGHACWEDKDPKAVAQFLSYCERHRKGFIQRLNQEMRYGWDDQMVDNALGVRAEFICDSYKKSYGSSI